MPGRRDSITGRDRSRDSRCKSVFVPTRLMFSVLFVIVLFINTNSNINRHVLLSFIETARISDTSDSSKKNLVLERWLSVVPASTKRQRRRRPGLDCGNNAHWTMVSISTVLRLSRRLCRRLCLLYCPGVVPACFRQGHMVHWLS